MKIKSLNAQFVEHFPDRLEPGELYLAMEFATAAHMCACGCGRKVITPFSPTDWQMSFDGETVSLKPSIGNWTFPCRSHYWIRAGRIEWSTNMSDEAIKVGRLQDVQAKARYEASRAGRVPSAPEVVSMPKAALGKHGVQESPEATSKGVWQRIKSWLGV